MKELLLLAGAFLLSATAAFAQNSMVGTWQGSVMFSGAPMGLNLVIMPDGRYSAQQTWGGMMTMDTGTYEMLPNSQVHFTVQDWEPKQQCFPQTGCHAILKPPGSLGTVHLFGSTMQLQDQASGIVINYQRVQ